jgi:hypothetical protein
MLQRLGYHLARQHHNPLAGKPSSLFHRSMFGPSIQKNQRIVLANHRFLYSTGTANSVGWF